MTSVTWSKTGHAWSGGSVSGLAIGVPWAVAVADRRRWCAKDRLSDALTHQEHLGCLRAHLPFFRRRPHTEEFAVQHAPARLRRLELVIMAAVVQPSADPPESSLAASKSIGHDHPVLRCENSSAMHIRLIPLGRNGIKYRLLYTSLTLWAPP